MSAYGSFYRHALFPFWERLLRNRRTPYYYDELINSQWLPVAEITRRQGEKRQFIIEFAMRESPFWQRRMAQAKIDPARCLDPEEWQRIPALSVEDIQRHRDDMLPEMFRNKRLYSRYIKGPNGEPVPFRVTRNHRDRNTAAWLRAAGWGGYELGEKYWLLFDPTGTEQDWNKARERLRSHYRRWRIRSFTGVSPELVREYIREINKYRPHSIFAEKAAASAMAEYALKEKIHITKCSGVIVGDEGLQPERRAAIEEAFGSPVFEWYSCREFYTIAAECDRHDGMHINSDGLYVEVVDEKDNPVSSGKRGRILVTSFDNLTMPFIRYRMNQTGVLTEEVCKCGRGLPRLKQVESAE